MKLKDIAGAAAALGQQTYVLLPARGLRAEDLRRVGLNESAFTSALGARATLRGAKGLASKKPLLKIMHATHADGAKLVQMGKAELTALRASNAGVRAVPEVFYEVSRPARLQIESEVKAAAGGALAPGLSVQFIDAKSKAPLKGVTVVAFTDLQNRVGAQAVSNAKGLASLKFSGSSKQLDAMVVYGPAGYWGLCKRSFKLKSGDIFSLQPVNLALPDYVALRYAGLAMSAGTGVKVGVIDSGVDGTHPDLKLAGGAAFVAAESDAGGFGPAARHGEHGTHVAGIIASRGAGLTGKRGVAPGVTLYSYRVFPNSGGDASNYDILRAIEQGVADGCDLLNLSLGGGVPDPAVHEAIKAAFDKGTLCIVASGNDGRQAVSFPAAWPEAVAVSAAGKKGSYPATSTETLDEAPPFSPKDKTVFVAQFSNVGPEIDLIGPGVGIVSTLPGGKYGVMSGTSMACPAVTGAAAALLAGQPLLLAKPRDRSRSIAMLQLLNSKADGLGMASSFEGLGMLP